MKRFSLLLMLAFALFARPASAAYCLENVTYITVHSNGYIYFSTDQTCSNWCQMASGPGDTQKALYAAMLNAQTLGKPVYFSWPNIGACTTQNAVYAQPSYIQTTP